MSEISDAAVVGGPAARDDRRRPPSRSCRPSNLANVNTPGYKAKELSFAAALDDQLSLPLAATNAAAPRRRQR